MAHDTAQLNTAHDGEQRHLGTKKMPKGPSKHESTKRTEKKEKRENISKT
jgi:hypothetical protein